MAPFSATFLLFFLSISLFIPSILTASVVEDLENLKPPPDFNLTITSNCLRNPNLRYCKITPFDLQEIFKSTIVASHLCNISNNPNCVESFPKIDLHCKPKIVPLYLSFTFFWKYCPLTILSIDLSNNSLQGNIPSEIFHCSQIQELDLSNNELSGDVPVQKLSPLTNLTFFNLSYNRFSECKISDKKFFKRFNSTSFIHSGLLPNHKKFRIKAVLLLVGFPIFVVVMVVWFGWLCFWRPDFLPMFLQRKHKFTPSILKAATNRFSKRYLVAKSSKSGIYKGILRDGNEVRVEIYWETISRESRRRFVEQCKILVQLYHKNIAPVLGWCDNRRFRAIVTKWLDGENIETWLSRSAPPWKQRVKVSIGIVAGICYLHEEWPEVGYDLKTRNIQLSEEGEPLISRFKFDHHNSSTKKIYKFGVFILEMVSNRRPLEDFERGETSFVEWVKMHYPDNLENVIDKKMRRTEHIVREATDAIGLGLMCTDLSSGNQPTWDQLSNMVSNV
ncbi:Leucine-rich repeat protein kinase family protein [Forsythia ovata]|uniref:Leucine-rich repeat protein kinase family protein n=1 Tax=Forsythia ovata TaxID=205694 RepID=A0ABD1RZX3_9LAMI